jgi:3-hydroxyisobutyrate dehydrogenase-like beta-hydroxyacid dehydrogenase
MPAGYSGAPLAKKLGLKEGMRVWLQDMPPSVLLEIAESATGVTRIKKLEAPVDCAHVFVTRRKDLENAIKALRPVLAQDGMIWVSWPKKAAKIETDITEDTIRDVVLRGDLVDVKVCAVDDVWSGLKLVIRKEARQPKR